MLQKILLIIGVSLLFLFPIWVFVITPNLQKIPIDYHHYEEQIGTNSIAPYVGAVLPESFEHLNKHELKVINVDKNNLKVMSTLTAMDVSTNTVFLDETRIFDVDRSTGSHIAHEKGYFVFPRNTQQQDYFLTFPLAFTHAVFSFKGIDVINGLELYAFSCLTQPYDISSAISVFQDENVRSFYNCNIWIEPVTGDHVKFELDWKTYAVNEQGEFIILVEKGEKETTSEYTDKLIELSKSKKTLFQMSNQFIPILLLFSGGVLIFLSRYLSTSKEIIDSSELQKSVNTLENTMNKTAQEIKKSSRLISVGHLAANISQELKNSISIIKTTSEMIRDRQKDSMTELDRVSFDRILFNVHKISEQINHILDLVKLSPLTLSQYHVTELLNSVLERLEISSNVKMHLPKEDVIITCDRTKMELVLTNLIINALKAINNDGVIHIFAKNDGNNSIISIQNSGDDIPESRMKNLFTSFYAGTSDISGLELVICKNLVEQHNGDISVSNNPPTFRILIPIKK